VTWLGNVFEGVDGTSPGALVPRSASATRLGSVSDETSTGRVPSREIMITVGGVSGVSGVSGVDDVSGVGVVCGVGDAGDLDDVDDVIDALWPRLSSATPAPASATPQIASHPIPHNPRRDQA
jgi:hypothetical protein